MSWPHYNLKRKVPDTFEITQKPTKMSKKNPVMVLNERYPGIEYVFAQEGSSHEPTFKASAVINEQSFQGCGSTKQKAKVDLATKALDVIDPECAAAVEESVIPEVQSSPNSESNNSVREKSCFEVFEPLEFLQYGGLSFGDKESTFNSDQDMPSHDRERPLYAPPMFRSPPSRTPLSQQPLYRPTISPHIVGPMLPPQAVSHGFSQLFCNRPTINLEKARAYPVMVVSELFPKMKIIWAEGSGHGDRQFKVEAGVQGRTFFGEGRSKKVAKLHLAKTILLCMYDIHEFKESDSPNKLSNNSETKQLEKRFPLTQLKVLVGENLMIDVVQHDNNMETGEKQYHATVVAKGVAYEAVGKNKNLAKLRAVKKALDAIRPKKEIEGTRVKVEGCDTSAEPVVKKEIDTTRHPTMVFCEFYRDVKLIEIEAKVANGLPEYSMEAEIEGKMFRGTASSKKKAKLRLVLSAFEELNGIPKIEWTSVDVREVFEDKTLFTNPAAHHPIVLLLKLNPQAHFHVVEDYECDATLKYQATARVGERDFNGEGPNKKSAKTAAAREALHTLYGIDPDDYIEESRTDYFANDDPKHEVPVELCNKVTQAVQDQFLRLFQGDTQCKVIAAFVLARYNGTPEASDVQPELQVVSIGTGTKCVSGDQVDHKGQSLNDCHGEIIACRGFRQYLYDELLLASKNDEDTILERQPSGKFSLKEGTCVYLFINTAPCGDGRIFTMQTQQPGAKNKTAGLLRTKIENGQGTIPVPENNIQTSDGLLEGERLRTMSCSDKILKWNALGVQGALLSYFIEPVYLRGIVIGLHYNYEALYRALYKRAGKLNNTPESYHLNLPNLGTPTNADITRDTSKATSNSFNWYLNQRSVEAVNATTGQTVVLGPSRLCKLNFLDRFMQTLKIFEVNADAKTYHMAKTLAREYQEAKECFFISLSETTCGKWIGKPYEHDMFGY